MVDEVFLRGLGWIIVAAAAFALLARLIKMPTIVAYLLAGLTLGPLTGLIVITESLELISDVGIALLLFLVGLELNFTQIRDVGRVALLAGLGQVVFTAAGGFVVCWLLGFGVTESIFLATALTFSSTVVVVKLLEEKQELNALYGRIAVGIFLVQDLVVIVVLTVLSGLSASETLSVGQVSRNLLGAFAGMTGLLVFALGASRYLLPKPFAWAARSPPTMFIWCLCWCFLVVEGAHVLNLSLEIGAFLAGLSLAQLPYNQDLRRRVHPLMNFFIAVFFVSLGIKMELEAAWLHWDAALLLSLFVLLGNPFIFIWIISRMGYGEKTSFLTSITVAQISEFSFIFVSMGAASGMVGSEVLSITALVGLVTIAASAYMILYNHGLYRVAKRWGLLRWFQGEEEETMRIESRRRRHVIVVGMNSLGRRVIDHLVGKGEEVLAVDTDPEKLKDLPCETMLGDIEFLSALDEADLPYAKLVVSALNIEETNELLAFRCRHFQVPFAVHVVDLGMIDNLLEMNATYLMIPKVDGIKLQTEALKRMGYLQK